MKKIVIGFDLDFLKKIDQYAKDNFLTRLSAIRQLILKGLKSE